jgi:hypothetical protein
MDVVALFKDYFEEKAGTMVLSALTRPLVDGASASTLQFHEETEQAQLYRHEVEPDRKQKHIKQPSRHPKSGITHTYEDSAVYQAKFHTIIATYMIS